MNAVAQRRRRFDVHRPSLVGLRRDRGDALAYGRHVGMRVFYRHSRFHAADHLQIVHTALFGTAPCRERRPDLTLPEDLESRRHHADDGVRLAIERQRAAHRRKVAAEKRAPELLTNDHDVRAGLGVLGGEGAPRYGPDP